MRKKGQIRMPEGYISTREAAKMLTLGQSTVARYFDRGILTGGKNPITNHRIVKKERVLALLKKYGMK